MNSAASKGSSRALIGGRYVVEAELGAGGMGVVSRALDRSTGLTVALKQLRSTGRMEASLFRREFHTLELLKHPRIVEVYDYGVDPAGPFYTMELLDGADLRKRAPVDHREACQHLRDVASSLALLAAHRLVHRDLSASNVRVTSEGRCKLIDFGSLTPFGWTDTVVGTPPYVAPEAVRLAPLDQRTDLFALGALAYYLLTRTHAFPARRMDELEAAWAKRPERPSARVARLVEQGAALSQVPPALDDLVLSLLGLDPSARPQSAAEAMERFGAVAGLEPEPGAHAAASYLLSASLVGRDEELARAKTLVAECTAGTGGSLVIHHAAGAGGSRFLRELSLEARLAGAAVLHVDAELVRGSYAVARALGDKLLAALPIAADAAVPPDLQASGWLRTRASERPSGRPSVDPTTAPLATRLKIQSALEQWFTSVARAHPLALVVDNAHEADEGSATLLALLAGTAREHRLAVFATFRKGDPVVAPAPLQRLERSSESVELAPLSETATRTFVQSLFGSAPNADRLAHWLHRRSAGEPLELMELSQHLVRSGVARYVGGTWALPSEMPADLPSRAEDAQQWRLGQLGPATLALGSALAMHRGLLPLDLCAKLAEAERVDGFAALDELTSSGVLTGHDGGYRFAQKSTRERLLSRLEEADRKRLHVLLGEHLLASGTPDYATTLDAGFHLLLGGDEARGAEILRKTGLEIAASDELPDAIPALEAAVTVYRKLKRPRNELSGLLHPLAASGYYVERRLGDLYGDEALALLAQETGLALTARVRPYVGAHLALVIGLVYALVLSLFGGRGGPRGLNTQIGMLGGLSGALVGASIICLDTATARRRAATFEPFEPLGLRHPGAFSHAMAKSLVGVTEDRAWETITALRRLLERLDTPGGVLAFPDRMRPLMRGGLLYALGALEAFMDEPIALERADELERTGLRLYDMVASQLRANYYVGQGNAELAREHERLVEVHALRNGSTWQAEVWAPSSRLVPYWRTYDLLGLKRSAEELEALAKEIPSVDRHARIARTVFAAARGDYSAAIPPLEGLLAETGPRGFVGWTYVAAILARAYNRTGQAERAEALCLRVGSMLTEDDRRVVALTLDVEIELAIAETLQGRADSAAQRLDALVRKHEVHRGPVTLGSLHRARAEVAAASGDDESAQYHHARMNYWFRATKNPSLIAECERVQAAAETGTELPPAEDGRDAATVVESWHRSSVFPRSS